MACFAGVDVTVKGWLGGLPSIGWEAPYIEPGWLVYPPNFKLSALWQRGPGGDEMCGDGPDECGFLIVHLRPGSTIALEGRARWVIAVGHRADPAAETCHFVFSEPWPDSTPPNWYAQDECRLGFVLTDLRNAP